MNARRFQVLQSRRKHEHDLQRKAKKERMKRHVKTVPLEKRMLELKPRPKILYEDQAPKTKEKKGILRRAWNRLSGGE